MYISFDNLEVKVISEKWLFKK